MAGADLAYLVLNEGTGVAYLAAAALVLASRPRRLVNVTLALFLAIEAANLLAQGLRYATLSDFLASNARYYLTVTAFASLFLYPLFFTRAIDSPLLRPLRHPASQLVLAALAAGVVLFGSFAPELYGHAEAQTFVYDGPIGVAMRGSWWDAWVVVMLAGSTLASYHAYRAAPEGSLSKRRSRAYLQAFVVNDVSGFFGFLPFVSFDAGTARFLVDGVSVTLQLVFLILLTRALLRDQLFDFDLKVKIGVKRGTIAGIFLAVFFVVSQLVQNAANVQLGYVGGAIAAGLLLFALAPIQRAAERVASAAVPQATGSAAYLAFQKVQVYRAQVESALADDGIIDERERAFLERLRGSLGLSEDDASAVERDVTPA